MLKLVSRSIERLLPVTLRPVLPQLLTDGNTFPFSAMYTSLAAGEHVSLHEIMQTAGLGLA